MTDKEKLVEIMAQAYCKSPLTNKAIDPELVDCFSKEIIAAVLGTFDFMLEQFPKIPPEQAEFFERCKSFGGKMKPSTKEAEYGYYLAIHDILKIIKNYYNHYLDVLQGKDGA